MEGYKFINSLTIQNLLSYGSSEEIIDLQPLNVIIGTNGVGKSNLIEVLGLLQGIPTDLTKPIREGGGVNEWLWKGTKETPIARIEAIINYPEGRMPLRYRLDLTTVAQRLELIDEAIENEHRNNNNEQDVFFFYRYQQGHPVLNARTITENEPTRRQLRREDLKPDQSVLSQRKDPDLYPELSYLSNQFTQIRLYREWNLGRYTPPRMPQKLDLPEDFLLEDGSNLGLILNDLQHRIGSRKIVENLQKFYESVTDITTKIAGGTVQIFLHERGLNQPIPATRLSDGTLRYLCLLMILLHPTPPPLICIEEPELGLHPDILPTIAQLLIDASQKTQLIVTTHSDALISALSEIPESILVCERDERGSRMRRLEPKKLKKWLKDYSLGDLWRMGEIGGNRW
ncbi:putative ABC transporter ATP-binding protein [Planktothrix agardhii CCAP 1459/11A]|uniref:Putative ABC transporter ATP-binding protein n=1 Tax=Planktothrix agardhii CCAP 1459/11A TaxID=282420 RepID=A0A4P5ZHQ1_PLAAG|nr:AAA family ATPase [Planktothrix agardhii]GDZ94654.1 putative ABC transporter ATP-binding protein [Planktothrix agardhii CCAP 1459/11A]